MLDQAEEIGLIAQRVITDTMRPQGYHVFTAEDPYERGDHLWVSPEGSIIFADSKGKMTSTFWRIGGYEEHGIDAAQYDNYVATVARLGVSGLIAVYEENREIQPYESVLSRKVLLYPLDYPVRRNTTTATYGRGGMVYWKRDAAVSEFAAVLLDPPTHLL